MIEQRAPLGIKLLAGFFGFGAAICLVTIVALLFPGGALEPIWRLNPDAHIAFQQLGKLSISLMFAVGAACAAAAIGLGKGARWGIPLTLAILFINLVGDLLNAFVRRDLRTLIGLPIGGAMIAYLLLRGRVRNKNPKDKHD